MFVGAGAGVVAARARGRGSGAGWAAADSFGSALLRRGSGGPGLACAANDPDSAVLSGLDGEFFSPMLDYAAEDRYYAGSQCG